MNILLFAGTTEGRVLAEQLCGLPVRATICVATEYGEEMLRGISGRFTVRTGRLNADGMRALMRETGCDVVIDATHPYASEVSANIRAASAAVAVPCLRLARGESTKEGCLYVDGMAAAADAVAATMGNVLLTTGSKDLNVFTRVPGFSERIFPRVLPAPESIRECLSLGFRRGHIIAMQGPFGRELNLALMRHFGIGVMVTKDGGVEGGFPDKMLAAEDAGVRVVVVGRPLEDKGLSLDDVLAHVRAKAGDGQ